MLKKTGQIRIIAGRWRGKKLPVADSTGLRPTPDRVRETLFNWLAPVLTDARCLDCFAGSGALGLEALSRHASHVVLLEKERAIAQQLKQNLLQLSTTQGSVIQTDSLNWLAKPSAVFDIVFIDPPFRQGLVANTIARLEQHSWLADEAWIYVETEAELTTFTVPPSWQLHREKIAGQVAYRLYHRCLKPQHSSDETP